MLGSNLDIPCSFRNHRQITVHLIRAADKAGWFNQSASRCGSQSIFQPALPARGWKWHRLAWDNLHYLSVLMPTQELLITLDKVRGLTASDLGLPSEKQMTREKYCNITLGILCPNFLPGIWSSRTASDRLYFKTLWISFINLSDLHLNLCKLLA